jgi:hypothetical protein
LPKSKIILENTVIVFLPVGEVVACACEKLTNASLQWLTKGRPLQILQ